MKDVNFINNKKADLSINMIVVAAIALLALVIISLIFIQRMNLTNKQVNNCEGAGGHCIDSDRFDSCNDADVFEDRRFRDYSSGTQRSDLKCYGIDGSVNDDEICCVFI